MDLNLDLGSDLDLGLAPASSETYSPSAGDAEYDPYYPSYTADQDPGEYSPSDLPIINETHPPPTSPQLPYDPISPPYVPHPPSSPPGVGGFTTPVTVIDLVGDDDDSPPPTRDAAYLPEHRLRRLIEANRRWRLRRFRSSLPYGGQRSNLDPPPSPEPFLLLPDIMSSRASLGSTASRSKAGVECIGGESSDEKEGDEERSKNAANFECNVCLDMAKEPVVTSCGHLFCWPCLYQWLHVHSEHKECPVCKGEVVDTSITPIYGRGSPEKGAEKRAGEEVESALKIPPRPRGNRHESLRQQLIPLSRRLGERIASLRQTIDRRMRFRERNERHAEASLSGVFAPVRRGGVMARLRPRRAQREEGNVRGTSDDVEFPFPETDGEDSHNADASLPFGDGLDVWHRFSFYGFTADGVAFSTDLSRAVGRFMSSNSNNNQHGPSASSADPHTPEQQPGWRPVLAPMAGDQASASSTMAMIEGDVAFPGGSVDPNSAGSSRSLRRRARSSNLASLDVDGGGLHGRKRRRLN